jgi:hypothetical protein
MTDIRSSNFLMRRKSISSFQRGRSSSLSQIVEDDVYGGALFWDRTDFESS